MAFNPKEHFLNLKGKPYLPVAARIAWMREEHPQWAIITNFIPDMSGSDFATFRAEIRDQSGDIIATAHKTEHEKHFPDYREKSETGAIGRAVALCGYGTLFAQELEEPTTPLGDLRIVDAPQEPRRTTSAKPANSAMPDVKTLGIEFGQAVIYQEGQIDNARIKYVYNLLTNGAERTPANLQIALTAIKDLSASGYQYLIDTLEEKPNA